MSARPTISGCQVAALVLLATTGCQQKQVQELKAKAASLETQLKAVEARAQQAESKAKLAEKEKETLAAEVDKAKKAVDEIKANKLARKIPYFGLLLNEIERNRGTSEFCWKDLKPLIKAFTKVVHGHYVGRLQKIKEFNAKLRYRRHPYRPMWRERGSSWTFLSTIAETIYYRIPIYGFG